MRVRGKAVQPRVEAAAEAETGRVDADSLSDGWQLLTSDGTNAQPLVERTSQVEGQSEPQGDESMTIAVVIGFVGSIWRRKCIQKHSSIVRRFANIANHCYCINREP